MLAKRICFLLSDSQILQNERLRSVNLIGEKTPYNSNGNTVSFSWKYPNNNINDNYSPSKYN